MNVKVPSCVYVLLIIYGLVRCQLNLQDCPKSWKLYDKKCYFYNINPERTYNDAMRSCINMGATLVSVNSRAEMREILNQLNQYPVFAGTGWYTSGSNNYWEGDGTKIPSPRNDFTVNETHWITHSDWFIMNPGSSIHSSKKENDVIVYQYVDNSEFKFRLVHRTQRRPYICEIAQQEVSRIFQTPRDRSYGMEETLHSSLYKFAPKIITSQEDTLIIGYMPQVFIDCIATGNPEPTYKWYSSESKDFVVKKSEVNEITSKKDPRYILSTGRLTINNPRAGQDGKTYQCVVENPHGIVMGNAMTLSFGVLQEFSVVDPSPIFAEGDKGAQIQCPDISYKEATLQYQWAKDSVLGFVRPQQNEHLFISANGKLYFSRVQSNDAGNYYCIVTLQAPGKARGYRGSRRILSRTSRPIRLTVGSADGGNQKPEIQDGFIAVYPSLPKINQDIQMECFAVGIQLEYKWERSAVINGKKKPVPLPDRHRFYDHNRILEIKRVQIEDGGLYTCTVSSGVTLQSDSTTRSLTIEAPPTFTTHLKDQYVDFGSQLTLRVMASAIPTPYYTWFHNGKQITGNNIEGITVNRNVIILHSLDPTKHNGVYQCAATNNYGTVYTSAELKVLKFKPTFFRQYVPNEVIAAQNGWLELFCKPEAAPYPTFIWKKDGNEMISSSSRESGNKVMTEDGTLRISDVGMGDEGRYECLATNTEGEASISTAVKVRAGTVINIPPGEQKVMVNSSASLLCKAGSRERRGLDLIYQWYFNNRLIKFGQYDLHFVQDDEGTLTIRDIQFVHDGLYTCVARTVADSVNASANVIVQGPPSEPAGVYVSEESISSHNLTLKWTDGSDNGYIISGYKVEGATNFDDYRNWVPVRAVLFRSGDQSTAQNLGLKKSAHIVSLNPGTSYKFRVRSINQFGDSKFSHPSTSKTTNNARPVKAVEDVGGGGGKVGMLVITWKPLSEVELHGDGIGYRVYWRLAGQVRHEWEQKDIYGQASRYIEIVGKANSYKKYEVKVRAFNSIDLSENESNVVIIHSAEDLPTGTPKKPYGEGFNSTALRIYWTEVPDTIDEIHGKLLGYKINYWIQDVETEIEAKQAILPGQANNGLLIGLEHNTFYEFNIQVYNTAGNGPKSENYLQTTFHLPPQRYPTEVDIHSVPGSHKKTKDGKDSWSVRVSWRGVSTRVGEEPLQGYIVRYWVFGTDIRNATDERIGRGNEATISDIRMNYRYQLRVLGYSRGGYGKMSMPAVTFVISGSSVIIDPSVTTEVAAAHHVSFSSISLLVTLLTYLWASQL